jgi:hypothetical protein
MSVSRARLFQSLCLLNTALFLGGPIFAQETQSASFKIAISIPNAVIHLDENPGITITETNLIGHPVQVGDGANGGIEIELLDKTGRDFGPFISGSAFYDPRDHPSHTIPSVSTLRTKGNQTFVLYRVFSSKYLSPGVYRLRIHNRELSTGNEIYSNSIALTLVP